MKLKIHKKSGSQLKIAKWPKYLLKVTSVRVRKSEMQSKTL